LCQDLSRLVENLPQLDTEQLHLTSDKFAGASGEAGYRTFLEILNWWMLRRIRTDATSGVRGLERWLKAWENVNELSTRADSVNLDRKQVVLNMFFELSTAAKTA
ncbi:MAG: hypothetical protein ACPHET_04145, partial [Miltoncostaeaceae bacterium]